jgi:OmpA-OmpF porin, OOP family
MARLPSATSRWAVLGGLLLLAACATPSPQPMHFNVYHVAFAPDSYSLDPAAEETIRQIAAAAEANKAASITILGRTDAMGNPDYNTKLSQKRAIVVRDALLATGKIAPDHIDTAWTTVEPKTSGADKTKVGSRTVDVFLQ